jgi:hypothetical protein
MGLNKIYNNFSVELSSTTTNSILTLTSTGGTYNGRLNASYIGTNTSLINNIHFNYLTGLTDYIQVQLNNKLTTQPSILNFTSNLNTGNNKILTGYSNVDSSSSVTNFTLTRVIRELKFNQIYLETGGDSNFSVSDLNPTNWNNLYPNRGYSLLIKPLNVIKINGVVGGSNGRVINISNVGVYPIIFENLNSNSQSENQFSFQNFKVFILEPNESITLSYDSIISKWTNDSLSIDYGFDFIDDFESNLISSTGLWPSSSFGGWNTFPIPTRIYSVYASPSGITTDQTAMKYDSNFETNLILYRGFGTGNVNRPGIICVGLPFGSYNYLQTTGKSTTMLSGFKINQTTNTLGINDNWAINFGLNNNRNLSTSYSSLTSNNTIVPQLSGGVFWNFDYTSTLSARTIVQTTGNTSTSVNSNFLTYDLVGNKFYDFGIYYLPKSGSSDGSATFFWNNKTNNSDNFKIIQSINVTNTETFGIPNITFYGAYNYSGNSNLDNVAGLCIDYLYFRVNNL